MDDMVTFIRLAMRVAHLLMRGTFGRYSESHVLTQGRLSRLELAVSALVQRLDTGMQRWAPDLPSTSQNQPPQVSDTPPVTGSGAPVLLIRDVAYEVGMRQQQTADGSSPAHRDSLDIITRGLITPQAASAMIALSVSLLLCFQC